MTTEVQKSAKILLIESDPKNAEFIMNLLRDAKEIQFNSAHASDLAKGLETLKSEKFDLILLNPSLSDSGGLYSLEKILANHLDIPVIVTNAPEDDDLALKCIRTGAQTYLLKGQIGVRNLSLEILFALERNARFQDQIHSSKLNSMAGMAKEFSGSLERPLGNIKEKIHELKGMINESNLDRNRARELLNDAEELSEDLDGIVTELKLVTDDVAASPNLSEDASKKQCRVLVVDDEPDLVESICRRLKRLGYENVDQASNGQEGYNQCIEKLRKGIYYDAIISDWNMPKLTGKEFLEKIRKNDLLRHTPFLMITAFDEVDRVREAISLKVNGYLVKPFKSEEFDQKVGQLLRKSKAGKS